MRKLFYALALLAFVGCSDGVDSGGTTDNNNNNNTTNEENTGSTEDTPAEFVPSFTPRYAAASEIKVMSFNVRLKTTEDNPANEWSNRESACITMIKHQQPTIFGVQEAKYTSQYMVLKEALAATYDTYGLNRDSGEASGDGETMAIFYDKSKIKCSEGGTFWLSDTPDVCSKGWDGACNRTATWGLFEHIATGKTFCYINTHLDHKGAEAKMNGPKVIMEHFKTYNPDGIYPQFLTGDMNLSADHEALDVFEETMVNTRTAAPSNRTDNSATSNGWKKTSKSIIDHIFCSKDMEVMEYHTVNEDYGVEFISDHYPIYAIIKM